MTEYLYGVYDLSEYQEPQPVTVEENHNPLTQHDDAWAALIKGGEGEKGFSVSRDGSLVVSRR